MMLSITTLLGFTLRLIIAIALGLLVGLERQWNKHQAGIMTNVIVCVGAYAFTAFGYFVMDTGGVDMSRIAAGIVSGIGFLGAGVILREQGNVRGLATAATIWTTAAVGILCTVDNILYAVIVAIAVVFMHLVLHPVSNYINKKNHYNKEREDKNECLYKLTIVCSEEVETDVRAHLIKTIRNKSGVLLHNMESHSTPEANVKIRAYITTETKNDDMAESLLGHVGKDEGVISAGWKIAD